MFYMFHEIQKFSGWNKISIQCLSRKIKYSFIGFHLHYKQNYHCDTIKPLQTSLSRFRRVTSSRIWKGACIKVSKFLIKSCFFSQLFVLCTQWLLFLSIVKAGYSSTPTFYICNVDADNFNNRPKDDSVVIAFRFKLGAYNNEHAEELYLVSVGSCYLPSCSYV